MSDVQDRIYWIDTSKTKQEKQSNGKWKTYYRCGCKICDKCWFDMDNEHCVYGGPFSGYKEIEDG